MQDLPSVSVVLVNYNGRHHLDACFSSLRKIEYAKDKVELILVDNGSEDGSVEFMKSHFPEVRVIPSGRNIGFAAACNLGARAGSGEYVALVNNDMKVHPGWLLGLVTALEPEKGIVCTSGRILDWEGEKVDFVRGALSFCGMGFQIGFGSPVTHAPATSSPMLFACGGSMLVDRRIYLDAGGFDEDFFAYFEDVDFGWRLWLMGYETAPAPGAIAHHRHHGTSGSMDQHRLIPLYERNAIWTLMKNLGARNLDRFLAASLWLAIRRALIRGGIERKAFELGVEGYEADQDRIVPVGTSTLVGLDMAIDQLPRVLEKRSHIQSRRKRTDADVMTKFVRPFQPLMQQEHYLEGQASVVRAFGLDEVFSREEASSVLILISAPERDGPQSDRRVAFARSLTPSYRVTLASESHLGLTDEDFSQVTFNEGVQLAGLMDAHSAVIMGPRSAGHLSDLPRSLVVVDGIGEGLLDARVVTPADVVLRGPGEPVDSSSKEVFVDPEQPVTGLVEILADPDRWLENRIAGRGARLTQDLDLLESIKSAIGTVGRDIQPVPDPYLANDPIIRTYVRSRRRAGRLKRRMIRALRGQSRNR